jgi:hypothetical protein
LGAPEGSPRRLACHRVFDEADHESDDCSGNAAAYGLSENGADIDIAGSPSEHRQESGKKLPAADATERARDGVAERVMHI